MASDLFTSPVDLSGLYARVALERGVDHPEGLTYSVPKHLGDLVVGERVNAPLGRGDRAVPGYVIEIGRDLASMGVRALDPARIKPLLARAARRSSKSGGGHGDASRSGRFSAALVTLAQWISQYYCCPIGLTLASMAPAAVKKQTGAASRPVLRRSSSPPDTGELSRAGQDTWAQIEALDAAVFPLEPRALADLLAHRTLAPINRLVRAGFLEASEESFVRSRGGPELNWDQADSSGGLGASRPTLNPAQEEAVRAVVASLGSFQAHLLYGVTGSGKTEVYLRALEEVIARGRTAIVLVPEISLTPQTAGRFVARFAHRLGASGVAVLHSGLSASQRNKEWSRVASGEARIVVGARSAIFAPFDRDRGAAVGLIIVDEEHDASYKQDQAPRYHARDVALRRGQLEGCPVLLGSATPSLETWHNATPTDKGGAGRFALHTLPDRVAGGRMPTVDVVDLVDEGKKRESADRRLRSIGPTLEHAIRRVLDRDEALNPADRGGGRVMLLLNRRGYASYICCPDQRCGWFMTCKHCDVTVVYHKRTLSQAGKGVVRCHHCLAEQRLPAQCPVCEKNVNTFGFGTQRLEDEIADLFPSLVSGETMLRLDSDTMRRASDYFSALDRFRRGEVRLLLGTQMIAKGLDFPDVELIGVINADTAINMPDFRAAERTFALVSQVAGRAGRSDASGKRARVIVQTFNPHEPAIQYAAAHDFEGFAAREIGFRREAGLPPVGRMARIVCRDEDAAKAQRHAHEIHQALAAVGEKRLRLRAPAPCPISRVAGHYRWAVELMAPTPGPIQNALAAIRASAAVRSDAHTAIDVDPVALL